MRRTKTKNERRAWWNGLSDDEKENYIARRQAQKTEWRRKHPKKEPAYDKRYPWITEGVTDSNREQWKALILKRNKWLDPEVFDLTLSE